MKTDYICQNPELSKLDEYISFCKVREKRLLLNSTFSFLMGILILIQFTATVLFPQEKILLIPLFVLGLVYGVCNLCHLKLKKYKLHLVDYLLPVFLIVLSVLGFLMVCTSAHIDMPPTDFRVFWYRGLAVVFGFFLLIIYPSVLFYQWIKLVLFRKRQIPKYYEYNSDSEHTAIIIPHNTARHLDFSGTEAFYLTSQLIKHNIEPFRVYFCTYADEVAEIISNKDILNLWIFGHGAHGRVDLTGGYLFYESFIGKDIPKKGYIHQFHCNPCDNEHDKYSLVSILVDEENWDKCTQTGNEWLVLKVLCSLPVLKIVGNYLYGVRSTMRNKKDIKKYIKHKLGERE